MKITIDTYPLRSGDAARGVGSYTRNLIWALKKYFPQHEYILRENSTAVEDGIIHIPYFNPFSITLPVQKKIKTVVTIHDLIPLIFPDHFPSGVKGYVRWRIQQLLLKNVDAIITDSHSSKSDIIRLTGIDADKIHVVYLAAGQEFIKSKDKSAAKKKFNLPDQFLLYVGDATWNKNLPNLVNASLQVGTPLVMVGKAIMEKSIQKNKWNEQLREVQGYIDNKNIIGLGYVSQEDLVGLYNSAACLVMPSFYEGFGLPILEAMQCGCPVVTSKNSSLEEIGDTAVMYIDPYSIDSIAEGIKNITKDKTMRDKLINKGNTRVKEFSWKKAAQETIKVYEKVY